MQKRKCQTGKPHFMFRRFLPGKGLLRGGAFREGKNHHHAGVVLRGSQKAFVYTLLTLLSGMAPRLR